MIDPADPTTRRAREVAALVRAGVRLQQPDALELAHAVDRWAELRGLVAVADLHHGTGCGTWRHEPRCTCGLDALRRAAR